MDKLKVLEVAQISPPPGSVPPTSLPCTYFDLLLLDGCPVKLLFFYRSPPQPKTVVPSLKHSLSLALKHYYPLAGNLKWPQHSTRPELAYHDGDSVAFTVAEYEADFEELLSSARAQDLDVFVPLQARFRDVNAAVKVPLAAFQVTFFGADKGVCIGITFSHTVCDGTTIFSFIKAWASLHTSSSCCIKDLYIPPFYDRSAILKGLEKKEMALLNLLKDSKVNRDTFHTVINFGNVVPKDVLLVSFLMSRNSIATLKHQVSAETAPWLYLSSFSVTCAYTWVCYVKARWGGDQTSSGEATEHLLLPVDIRTRLDSPVPVTYFGNCGASLEVMAKRSELLGGHGVVIAAELIGKAIQNIDVYGELEKNTSYYASLPPERILAVGSYPKFGAYSIDFGWGRPKRYISNTFDNNGTFLMLFNDSPNHEGGIEVGFVGKPDEVDNFASAFATSLGSHVARSMI